MAIFGASGSRSLGTTRTDIQIHWTGIKELSNEMLKLSTTKQKKALRKALVLTKNKMVRDARNMLKPHKQSGLLARSLGSIRSPKSKRTPRIHPETGDMIQVIAPRKEQSQGKVYQRKGRSKPEPRDPRFYAHLVDIKIDFYGRMLKQNEGFYVRALRDQLAKAIAEK